MKGMGGVGMISGSEDAGAAYTVEVRGADGA